MTTQLQREIADSREEATRLAHDRLVRTERTIAVDLLRFIVALTFLLLILWPLTCNS